MTARAGVASAMDPTLLSDKLAGLLAGIAAGEALGRPAEGLARDEILRRHGRIVHIASPVGLGPLARLALRVATHVADGRQDPAELVPHLSAAGSAGPVIAALVVATAGGAREAARRGRDLARLAAAGDEAVEAAGLAASAAAFALPAAPELALHAGDLLAALRDECASGETRAALDELAALARTRPAPGQLAVRLGTLPDALREAFLGFAALLVRPRSSEAAVVLAVNLGGAATARGALAGGLAGLHRGGASLPERWLDGPVDRKAVAGAVAGLLDRRGRRPGR